MKRKTISSITEDELENLYAIAEQFSNNRLGFDELTRENQSMKFRIEHLEGKLMMTKANRDHVFEWYKEARDELKALKSAK